MVSVLEWLVFALASFMLAFHTIPNAWRTLNTDFPNYYLTAQLARDGYDMTQAYDWRWLQREKNHRAAPNPAHPGTLYTIDQRIVGLAPITPFSTLFLWPLTSFAPLTAKHIWLLLQLALLLPIAFALRSLTALPLRRVALLAVVCLPLHRNLLYGQFYILLLGMIVAACLAYCRRLSALAGALIALATMTKIFPAVFLFYFLRKRDLRALAAACVTFGLCAGASIIAFGWTMHRYYLQAVLPSALRGEVLPPYLLASSSLSTLFHRLFLYEPQWNPHPWHDAPRLFAVLVPTVSALILAPAIFLITPYSSGDDRSAAPLEWSALLCATLAVSTSPASYNFTLLIFPISVLCARLLPAKPALAAAALLLYLGIGFSGWDTTNVDGLGAVLREPRLLLLLAFSTLCSFVLYSTRLGTLRRMSFGWPLALIALAGAGIIVGMRHQRGLKADDAYRLPMQPEVFFSADPAYTPAGIEAISLLPTGYRLTSPRVLNPQAASVDELTFTHSAVGDWIEQAAATSRIVSPDPTEVADIPNARNPILLRGGGIMAFLRDDRGRGRLFEQPAIPLTPPTLNVFEAAAGPDATFFVAGSIADAAPEIFRLRPDQPIQPMDLGQARYPSVSPDGRWLAFSRFRSGAWNLYLLDLRTNAQRRLTDAACNQIEPSWEPDSRTLLYASDCGRALGFTAICRRRVLP